MDCRAIEGEIQDYQPAELFGPLNDVDKEERPRPALVWLEAVV